MGEIAVRRRGPETLPDSIFLVLLLFAIHTLVNVVDLLLIGVREFRGFANLAVQDVLLFSYVFAVLNFFGVERRYKQTISALLGVDIVLYLIFFFVAVVGVISGAEIQSEPILLTRLFLVLWWIAIASSILARALSQPFILGFMFQVLFLVLSFSVSEFFLQPAD